MIEDYEIINNGGGYALIHKAGQGVGFIRHFEHLIDAQNEMKRLEGIKGEELGITAGYPSEAAKYLSLTKKYLVGNGLDLGSGGWPVVGNAIQVELPMEKFLYYTNGRPPQVPIQWHGDIFDLPFKDETIDWIHASHLIEDFSREDWAKMFLEWRRVLKVTGHIVILVPDKELWGLALARGQPPNCSHYAPEPSLGDVSKVGLSVGLSLIEERMTNMYPDDYSILCVFGK